MAASTTMVNSGRPRLRASSSRGASRSVVAFRRKPSLGGSPANSSKRMNLQSEALPYGPEFSDHAQLKVPTYGSSGRRRLRSKKVSPQRCRADLRTSRVSLSRDPKW
jgi:hypothetical protein